MTTKNILTAIVIVASISFVANHYAKQSDIIFENCNANVELQICE